MNKFLIVFLTLCFIGQQAQAKGGLRLRKLAEKIGMNGDLRPKHRHLSEEGQLNLGIQGRGYFQFRLRVKDDSAAANSGDASQQADGTYNGAYADTTDTDADTVADGKPANNSPAGAGSADGPQSGSGAPDEENSIEKREEKDSESGGTDRDSSFFSQVVYSRDGSLHVNRFGYLVDDNGLLMVGEGKQVDGTSTVVDDHARFHIHIPSRAEGIVVTPTGSVLAEELGGSKYTKAGQIMLARFENPQGLNVRLKMKSNCVAADEDGFALGNWCAGTELDGKDHTYMAETSVSGPGIMGKPGDQGFGRIIR
jgi:hypothetical protein